MWFNKEKRYRKFFFQLIGVLYLDITLNMSKSHFIMFSWISVIKYKTKMAMFKLYISFQLLVEIKHFIAILWILMFFSIRTKVKVMICSKIALLVNCFLWDIWQKILPRKKQNLVYVDIVLQNIQIPYLYCFIYLKYLRKILFSLIGSYCKWSSEYSKVID